MRDPDNGIKELKLEKEKKIYNHCFSGITQYESHTTLEQLSLSYSQSSVILYGANPFVKYKWNYKCILDWYCIVFNRMMCSDFCFLTHKHYI